ncbi:MAG: hypothetical protein M1358_02835 [Chloroflexi bacterium]|nr:hypothetical protein [Chloroflexota bacterium]
MRMLVKLAGPSGVPGGELPSSSERAGGESLKRHTRMVTEGVMDKLKLGVVGVGLIGQVHVEANQRNALADMVEGMAFHGPYYHERSVI